MKLWIENISVINEKSKFQCWFTVEFCVIKLSTKMSAVTYTSDIDICQRVIPSETYYEPNGTYYTQIYSNSLLEQPEGLYDFIFMKLK